MDSEKYIQKEPEDRTVRRVSWLNAKRSVHHGGQYEVKCKENSHHVYCVNFTEDLLQSASFSQGSDFLVFHSRQFCAEHKSNPQKCHY